jgi:phosphatidate cytidylyltransferase
LVHLNKVIPFILAAATYTFLSNNDCHIGSQLRFNNTFDLIVLGFTLFVFLKHSLSFDNKTVKIDSFSKYIYLIGYVILPFVIMTKIPFGINGYNPKILISIFILIWTNDSFAYIVGIYWKTKLFERISPKKTIEGFMGGVVFCVVASYLISKYYIEIAEGKMFIWIITLIVGVLVLPVI